MKNIDSLKNTSEFKEVYENGQSAASKLLVLYTMANGEDRKRLGISVSKKVGNSVVRHRITRIIRECFLKMKEELPSGYSFVVVARVHASGKNLSDIYGALQYLMKKQRII